MSIFGNNSNTYNNTTKAVKTDREFKLFVESKIQDGSCDKYTGYTDSKIIELLREEFSMYKNASPTKEGEVESKKSKIPSFESIHIALRSQDYGTTFTTPQSDRIYVITKGTWGEKSDNKVVKGFPLSTDMDKIKLYAKRTKVKHGGSAVNILDKDEVTPTMLKGKGKNVKLNKFKKEVIMSRPYNPKTDLYNAPRIQKEFKTVLKDIEEDREKAWEAYEYFKAIVEENPEDFKAKSEMVKCLEIYTNTQNTKMKALDSLVKIRVHLDKTPVQDNKAENLQMLSFDDLKQKKYQ